MVKFYLETTCGEDVETASFECLTVDEARARAMKKLRGVWTDTPLSEGTFRSWTVVLRNDRYALVCRLILTVIDDDLGDHEVRTLRPIA